MNTTGKPTLVETLPALEAAVLSAPVTEIPELLGLMEKLKALGWGRMLAEQQHGQRETTGKTAMTAQDVAPILNVKPSMVYELVRTNRLKAYRVGKYLRFSESAVQEFLANGGA